MEFKFEAFQCFDNFGGIDFTSEVLQIESFCDDLVLVVEQEDYGMVITNSFDAV